MWAGIYSGWQSLVSTQPPPGEEPSRDVPQLRGPRLRVARDGADNAVDAAPRTPPQPQLAGNYYFRLCCVLSSWGHDTTLWYGGTGGRDISAPAYLCPLANVCIICAGCPGCAPGAVRGPVLLLSIMLLDTLLVTVTTPATLISNHDTRNNAFHALHFRVALSSRYNYNLKNHLE